MKATGVQVEKARMSDIPQIHKLVNYFAEQGEMLARPLSELYENIRDYFVIRDEAGRVVACASLHVNWEDLAEVKAVAVAPEWQDKGLGRHLLQACVEEARLLGIPTLFCLTYRPYFYEKHGFTKVDVMSLPRKVWGECFRCPKFPNCDEVALVRQVELPAGSSQ